MADKPAAEQTEDPTPERIRRAREEGKLAQSHELPSAMLIVLLVVALAMLGPLLLEWLAAQVRQGLSFQYGSGTLDKLSLAGQLQTATGQTLLVLLPVVLIGVFVSLMSALAVSGVAVSPKAVKIDWGRIAFGSGLQGLFSMRALVSLITSMVKFVVIGAIVYFYLGGRMAEVLSLGEAPAAALPGRIGGLVLGLMIRVCIAMVVLGLLDLIYQKWKYRRDLRMTRQEVKEEFKQHEVSPRVKGRIRTLQFEMARRRMLKDVPLADVIVVNPDHVAVAIKYETGKMRAPLVVAKGVDFLAEKIKEIASANNVPIMHRPRLAWTLYETVDIGEPVPEKLFVAIAEVLAMIYRLRARRRAGARMSNVQR